MKRLAFVCAGFLLVSTVAACGVGTSPTAIPTFVPAPATADGTPGTPNALGTPQSTIPIALTAFPPTATIVVGMVGSPQPGSVTTVPLFAPSATPGSGSVVTVVVVAATPIPGVPIAATPIPGATTAGVTGSTTCTSPANWTTYTVQSGDTLSSIAASTGTTVTALVSANCLANPDQLTAGQTLYVPTAPGGGVAVTSVTSNASPVPLGTLGSAQGCLAQTPVPGASPATVQTLVVQPGTALNGTYQVTTSQINLIAQNVQNAVKVRFCLSVGNSVAQIGEVAVVNNQAVLQWQIPGGFNAMTIGTKAIAPDGSVWDGQSVSIVKTGAGQ